MQLSPLLFSMVMVVLVTGIKVGGAESGGAFLISGSQKE